MSLRRFHNLRTVLLLQVALPVFLLLGLLLFVTLEIIGQVTEERLQRDLRQVARAIQLPVAQALERDDFAQLSSSLASIFGISEVYGAYLFDAEGNRMLSFGSVDPGPRPADLVLRMTVEGEREFDQYERISGRNVYSFFLPLFDTAGQPNGLLQVTRRRSDIEEELGQLRTRAWLGFGVVFLLMMACLLLAHYRGIGQPMGRLLGSMERVRQGDREHRAAVEGPEEIRRLAQGLNVMLDAIHAAEEDARQENRAREQVTRQLRQAETMAALGQISAGVAHELGAPLSVVDGRAKRLLRHREDERDRRELEAIREQVGRMSRLVRQLLSFGRNSRLRPVPLRLSELFARIEAQAREEQWPLRLVPGPADSRLEGDSFSLEQALLNLLRNAAQACPGGPVEAGWREDGEGRVLLFVEDAGPGIAADMEDQLFEPFVTSKLPGEGSGMGLAIVQRVVREHHGEIHLAPSTLGGARFEIRLPVLESRA